MQNLWYGLVFMLGGAVGSFLNVLVNRSIEGRDWVRGKSECDHCKKSLRWFDMVPVLSYVVYGGKSRCCGKRLSWQHLIVEVMVGLLFLWWVALSAAFFHLVSEPAASVQPLFWLITGIVLAGIVIADLYYGIIPLSFVVGGTVILLVYRGLLILMQSYRLLDLGWSVVAAAGTAGFYLLLRGITKGKGMGDGDVVLALYLGLLLGWPRILVATFLAFVSGAACGVGLMLAGRKKLGQTIPFGPFMVLGAVLALVWGKDLLRWWLGW